MFALPFFIAVVMVLVVSTSTLAPLKEPDEFALIIIAEALPETTSLVLNQPAHVPVEP